MGDKLGGYGGQIGRLWGTNWEAMGDKLGGSILYGGQIGRQLTSIILQQIGDVFF